MKKLTRLAASLLTATAIGAAGLVVSTSAPAAAASGVYYSAYSIKAGQTLTIHGTSPAKKGTVTLYAKPYHGTSYHAIRRDSTPSSFSFAVKPLKYTKFYVRYVNSVSGGTGATSARGITVHRKLSRPAVHSRARTITGRVYPRYKKRRVTIQKRRCTSCAWRRAKIVRTNKWSKWTLRIPVKKMQYRAVVGGSNGLSKSFSPVTKVVVTYGRQTVG